MGSAPHPGEIAQHKANARRAARKKKIIARRRKVTGVTSPTKETNDG